MLSRLREYNSEICILRIHSSVLDLNNCIVSDRNASSDYARFYNSINGIKYLDFNKIFSVSWIHHDYDEYEKMEHKSIKCAEALIPLIISSEYIIGAYVINDDVKEKLIKIGFNKPVTIKTGMFFGE